MADGAHGDLTEMIDWDLAVVTAKRLMRPGPDVSRDEARQTVVELRECASVAEGHVRAYTGLHAESATAPVLIVDRVGWVQANADGFKVVLRPLIAKIVEKRGDAGGLTTAIGARVTGVEAGGLLAYLATKVLGQFDPFADGSDLRRLDPRAITDGAGTLTAPRNGAGDVVEAPPKGAEAAEAGAHRAVVRRADVDAAAGDGAAMGGRLLLVAPNVVNVERELGVDPHDFRLWVCLHEETHRVQFTAVPWLREHMLGEIAHLLESTELDPQKLAGMLRDALEQVARMVRGDSEASLLDLLQTQEQKEVLERITAVMSLLEGHADVVMDGVGPQVVPSVEEIRRKFTARRAGAGPLDQLIRRLLGLDAKLRQYRDGAVFVRGVVDKVGMEGFNAVWAGPQNLPGRAEIADPARWVARVHG